MTQLSVAQIYGLARQAGFAPAPAVTAAAIAMAESGGDPAALSNNPYGGTNVGLWQLDTPGGVGAGYSVAQLKDPRTNAAVAYKGSSGGQNWGPWSTYGGGQYRQYIGGAQAAAAQEAGGATTQSIIGDIGNGIGIIAGGPAGVIGALGALGAGSPLSGLSGIEKAGAVLEAFYETITDGKLWRSVGYLLLGVLILFAGLLLWLGKSGTVQRFGRFAAMGAL